MGNRSRRRAAGARGRGERAGWWDGGTGYFSVGVVVLLSASLIGLCSGWTLAAHGSGTPLPLDGTRRLVVRGPYRHIRNPMVTTAVAQMAGVSLMLGSRIILLYALAAGLIWQWLLRPREERYLATSFGAAYEDYRRQVRCWIPRLRPCRPAMVSG